MKKQNSSTEPIAVIVRLPSAELEALDELATAWGLSRNACVRIILAHGGVHGLMVYDREMARQRKERREAHRQAADQGAERQAIRREPSQRNSASSTPSRTGKPLRQIVGRPPQAAGAVRSGRRP